MNKYLTKIASLNNTFADMSEDEMIRSSNPAWMTEHIARKYGHPEFTPGQIASHNLEHGDRASVRGILHGIGGAALGGAAGYGAGALVNKAKFIGSSLPRGLGIIGASAGAFTGIVDGYTRSLSNQAREAHEEFGGIHKKAANEFKNDVANIRSKGAYRTENMIARRVGDDEVPRSKADDMDQTSILRASGRSLLTGLGGAVVGAVGGKMLGKLHHKMKGDAISTNLKNAIPPGAKSYFQGQKILHDAETRLGGIGNEGAKFAGGLGALGGLIQGERASRRNQVNEMYDRHGITRK